MTTTLVHHFRPRGAAAELMRYRGGEVLIAGAAGTGKSRTALEKAHLMCLLTPKVKTAVSLTTSAIATYERDVAAQALLDGTVTRRTGSRESRPRSCGSALLVYTRAMMNAGTTVRFSPDMLATLLHQVRHTKGGAAELHRHQAAGMTVQGEPRPGRINVKFERGGYIQYRTFAARDLVAA